MAVVKELIRTEENGTISFGDYEKNQKSKVSDYPLSLIHIQMCIRDSSQATKLPYVICDQESFNDQVWVFATEEEIKAFGKKKLEDKILLMGMKYEKKDYPRFYGTLYAIGVNSVVWVDGENQIEVCLLYTSRCV